MPDDYRDRLLRPPAPPAAVTPAEALALALGWQPVYLAPLAPPARWIAPDGTAHATLPAWETLLAEVTQVRNALAALRLAHPLAEILVRELPGILDQLKEARRE